MAPDQAKTIGHLGETRLPDLAGNYLPANDVQKPFYNWPESEEIQLRDYLEVIVRRKWLILTVLALVFLSTLIFTLTVTRIYEASAVVEVSQENPHVTTFQEVLGSEIQAREFYETQVELIRSKAMINRVIERLDLIAHPVVRKTVFNDGRSGMVQRIGSAFKSLAGSVSPGQAQPAVAEDIARRQKVAKYLSDNLTVSPSRKSMLIDVAFRSPDRQLSQSVVNTIVEDFIRWKMELKVEASGIARDFLMMQMDRAKINLEKAEERLNEFAKHAGIVSLDARINSIYRHLEELNSTFAAAEANMITKAATYDQAVKDGHANLPRVLESDLIASLKDKYADLNASYEELRATFHDDYPKVKTLKARMDSISALIEEQEKGIFLSIENEYESAQKVVSAMEKRIENQKKLVLDLNDRATQYSIMAREVDTNKAIYQSLLQRAKEIESMAGVSSSNIQIVNRADLPLLAVKPNVNLNLLLSLVLGLLGGVGCAFVAEYFADTVTNPSEISDRFQIPLLGTIPQAKPDGHGLENAFLRHPRSPFSEAIRSTRVSVQLSGSGARSKCFLITSTLPSEGKTTLAVNLALSFAAAGEKTVLIDADLRKPRLHEVFNLNHRVNGNGVSSFLAGVTNQLKIYNHQGDHLGIIPSGPVPPNPAELLASRRFNLLLKRLIARYDRIILDGPPHIGFADTLILSKCVGGIVLVSSIGESSREAIGQFKKSITNVQGTILGCIVNKVDFNRKYGYGGYYKSYQSYSSYGLEKQDNEPLLENLT
ncbi:MAG: polysaccharide biosynthesis tyrosine autokinase [Deltaproteobacteria bacterium]|nr:polysaccharide biosynthesis tyrosine autokinase [Deltaproteobacteria bacterium]